MAAEFALDNFGRRPNNAVLFFGREPTSLCIRWWLQEERWDFGLLCKCLLLFTNLSQTAKWFGGASTGFDDSRDMDFSEGTSYQCSGDKCSSSIFKCLLTWDQGRDFNFDWQQCHSDGIIKKQGVTVSLYSSYMFRLAQVVIASSTFQ